MHTALITSARARPALCSGIYYDLKDKVGCGNLSGNYEMELLNMLMTAFNSAKIVQPLESLIITKE